MDANVTAELKAAGFDQVAKLDGRARMECQMTRLDLHMRKMRAAPRPCITDRSPLDIGAYTLAEFAMHSDPELATMAAGLVETCIELTGRHYDTVILVPPLPHYLVEDGKPPPNVGFQWHIHHLIAGFQTALENTSISRLLTNSLEDRVDFCAETIGASLEGLVKWRAALRHLH